MKRVSGLILLEIPSSDIPAGILAPPVLGSSIYCVNCVYIGAAVIRMLPVCTCDSNIFMGFVACAHRKPSCVTDPGVARLPIFLRSVSASVTDTLTVRFRRCRALS